MTKAIAEKIEELAEQDSMHESVDFGLSRMSFMSGARAYEALVKAELEAALKDVYGARDTIHGEYCYDHPIEECGSLKESIKVLKGLIDEPERD